MKRSLRSLAVALFCALGLAAAGAASASAETMDFPEAPYVPVPAPPGHIGPMIAPAHDTFACNLPWSTVQAAPSGYAIGSCTQGTHIRRSVKSAPYNNHYWDGGYIFGNFGGCAFVQNDFSNWAGSSSEDLCPGMGAVLDPSAYMQANNNATGPDGGCSWKDGRCTTGTRTTIVAQCAEYGNFRPWLSGQAPTDPTHVAYPGQVVRWRYITRFGAAADNVPFVMVKDERFADGEGAWVFVHASCIASYPGYTTSIG